MSELDQGTTADQQEIIDVWLSDDSTDPGSPEQSPVPDQGYDQPNNDPGQVSPDPGQGVADPDGVGPSDPDTGGAPDDVQPGADPGPDGSDGGGGSGDTDYPDVVVDGQLIGDPQGASEHWFEQAANGFCLPSSLAQIISEYTGVHYGDEQTFVDWANEDRLFQVSPDGVPGIAFQDGVQLLEKAGVPATLGFGDLNSLAEDLAEGRGIVLFVDSGEIWEEGGEAAEDNAPDHAVVLSGIDTARGVVFLSDPGSPDGNMEEVSIETFNNAWADSQNAMIVCDQPDPDVLAVSPADPDVAPADGTNVEQAPVEQAPVEQAPVEQAPVEQAPVDGALEYAFRCATGWVMLPICLLPADRIGG